MHVMITGAAGMIGCKLVERLLADGTIGGTAIGRLTLVDVVTPTAPETFATEVEVRTSDLSTEGAASDLVSTRPDLIFHFAAIVSGEAEADFEKGYKINLDGTRALFEAIRLAGDDFMPRVIFTSSIAVFGAPFPEKIGDDFLLAPLTSYGTQKAICELLLSDYSRRGFLDGVGLRLPTICIRPGRPNRAASGFFSSILREPLKGEEAVLPVGDEVRHWFASPRAAVGYLIHAAALDTGRLGDRRNLSMPGISAQVGDQIEALRRVAGDEAVARIRREPDAEVKRMVSGWPRDFETRRALELGFTADASLDAIIRTYIEDEMHGTERTRPDP